MDSMTLHEAAILREKIDAGYAEIAEKRKVIFEIERESATRIAELERQIGWIHKEVSEAAKRLEELQDQFRQEIAD